jgi:coproporphyrinogen III oxidase
VSTPPTEQQIEAGLREVHDHIADYLSEADGHRYREDRWDYEKGSGGGVTRIWEHSELIERGGVNFSAIRGDSLPGAAASQFKIPEGTPFFATGVSLVVHPWNPHVPTIHLNVRHFSAGEMWWFGGGVDLTPNYPVKAQVIAFHVALKKLCEAHEQDYAAHKAECDDYFLIRHRRETRGIGGLFFDHMRNNKAKDFEFIKAVGHAFPDLYRPIVDANRDKSHTDDERQFQLYRRSRYVEFNLVYDRGTLFGLQSGGRIESILMSMPAQACWRYDWHPEPGTREAELTDVYLKPQDWAGMAE